MLCCLTGRRTFKERASRPISRVLSRVVIYLGERLPFPSCGHTLGLGGPRPHPSIRPCSGRGLPGQPITRLPVVSYTTISPLPLSANFGLSHQEAGHASGKAKTARQRRYVSVALSLRSPLLGVTQRPALWSPDFPQAAQCRPRLPSLLTTNNITGPVEGVKACKTLDIQKYRLHKSTSAWLPVSTIPACRLFPRCAHRPLLSRSCCYLQ